MPTETALFVAHLYPTVYSALWLQLPPHLNVYLATMDSSCIMSQKPAKTVRTT